MDKSANASSSLQPAWLEQAIAQGLLPANAQAAGQARPWPVVLLTALGAWFAGIFLLASVGLLAGSWLLEGAGGIVVGPILLAATVFVLRQPSTPLFVEQLAAPMLWVGGAVLALGLVAGNVMRPQGVCVVLVFVSAAVIALLPRQEHAWLRLLLGFSMATLLMVALVYAPGRGYVLDSGTRFTFSLSPLIALYVLVVLWAVAIWLGTTRHPRLLAWWLRAQSGINGWGIAVLLMCIALSGQTFLLGGSVGIAGELAGGISREAVRELSGESGNAPIFAGHYTRMVISAMLAVLASWVLVRTIKQRQLSSDNTRTAFAAYGVVIVLAVMACFLTMLGAVLLIASVCIAMRRHKLAALAAFVAAWIVGSFYYSLTLPLATKAMVLAGAGALLALFAWWAHHQRAARAGQVVQGAGQPWLNMTTVGILVSATLTLAVANFAIHEKESLIRDGQHVYIPLAPRDPRSLMQGDYMALNFRAPAWDENFPLNGAQRPYAVGKLNVQGVLALTRFASEDDKLAADEIRVQLTAKNGQWTVVTDAWFFAEGDAQRWEAARYGEFRVMPDGRALLVGMADENLKAIEIKP